MKTKRRVVIVLLACVSGALLGWWMWRGAVESGGSSVSAKKSGMSGVQASHRSQETRRKHASGSPRELSRAQLLAARNEPEVLAEQLDFVLKKNRVADDVEIMRLYRSNMANFPPEVLGKLSAAWGASLRVNRFVASKTDPAFVAAYCKALRAALLKRKAPEKVEGAISRTMRDLARYSPLFSPDRIVSTLSMFPELSRRERVGVGSGIASRIEVQDDKKTKINMLNAYFTAIEDTAILKDLVSVAVEVMDDREALEWLTKGDPELMSHGDVRLIDRAYKSRDFGIIFELVDRFVENRQIPRAQKAIEEFLFGYAKLKPKEAFEWANSLDSELHTEQMSYTTVKYLFKKDPDECRRFIEATTDPKLKAEYEKYFRKLSGENSKTSEK